ncbi:TetR family transcriptional regulator [Streptomyces corynorhini]|uniref:TetR family transcriptional regulator n=1 Tax=Streptomyces corynorhini TaxID=2282652 RepID=A0A370B6T0_9ACTN|nr:TetR family transcriptional regulator [Streptomyces corynorhini]
MAAAAFALLAEDGPGALSFRTVAARLGVAHATVQRRCGDLAGLLDLCADQLAAELPDIPPGSDWATATETRFRGLYAALTARPGLLALRGGRPWLGPRLLGKLVEPQLADSVAAGMTPEAAFVTYRQLYLLTLGSATFVDHRDPEGAVALTRTALAALDPAEFPLLTGHLAAVLPVTVDHEVYYAALRALIHAAEPPGA